jgi:periplasmic protein TonB
MSNVSVFEKKWIDLVFEGKNQEYGAYQLRQENPKTTLKAFCVALFSISFVSGIGFFFSSFTPKPISNPIPDINDSIVVVKIVQPPKENKPEKPEPKTDSKPVEKVPVNKPFVVVATPQADPVVPINNDIPKNNTPIGGTGTGTSPLPIGGESGGGTGTDDTETKKPTGPVIAAILDAQPEFPGGIKKFYQYVGDNFERQEIEDVESITVNVSFVIEKDGSLSDIRVLRNPGYGLDKEAIRVLKSLKTKWKAGVLNGEPVRTLYTLPITVRIN